VEALDRLTADIRQELADIRREMAHGARDYGEARWAELREANEHLILAAVDAEQRAERATADLAELTQSSQFDALTGTPTRTVMSDRLGEALSMARRRNVCLALLYLDLDGFKQVNDTKGHAVGDELLQCVAQRLRHAVRESDTVSRQGGDEFLVLLPEVSGRPAVMHLAQKILLALAEPMPLRDKTTLRVSASIGIALWPDDGDDIDTLVERADAAMYDAKRRGGNGCRLASGSSLVDAPLEQPGVQPHNHHLLQNLRDVNEQLLLAALRAQELLDAAELSRKLHGQAMAVFAHELRNPLAPIRTAAQLLLAAHSDDARIEKAATVIDRQAGQLRRLIDDLLDGVRTGNHEFQLNLTPVALLDVLERAIDATHTAMLSRRQVLRTRLPSKGVILDVDPTRLEQVFSNLLDNASKYTPAEGCIDLTVEEGDLTWVTVTVRDNGRGIAREALPHIFDLFVQEQRFIGTGSAGLGIGLAVVKELVQVHGGTVAASSLGVDRGSEFVVRLPRRTAVD
jgi:diguanylate cyclase (GGDEF)-like protein